MSGAVQGAALPWVLATRNEGKLRELRALLGDAGVEVVDLGEAGLPETPAEEHIECYETFEQNAMAKARYFSALLPGRVVVADDSGLAVDALAGAPGVHSKRWCGRTDLEGRELDAANNALLAERLREAEDRTARFVCVAVWTDGSREHSARGEVPGRIVDVGSGAHGFGYDPYFHVDELGMTLADATVAEKQEVSHRGRAFAALLRAVERTGGG